MIRLRKPERSDAARLCVIFAGEVGLPGYHLPKDEEDMNALIDEWNRGEVGGRRFEMLLIEADGLLAGLLSLFEQGRGASLGISVHPAFQRRGIGKRAVQLAAEYAISLGWETLISECRTDNAASIALHEACAFRRIGKRINRKGNCVIDWEKRLKDDTKKE